MVVLSEAKVFRHCNGREMGHGKDSHFFMKQFFMLISCSNVPGVFLYLKAKLACANAATIGRTLPNAKQQSVFSYRGPLVSF
jgi:hypothetical protein